MSRSRPRETAERKLNLRRLERLQRLLQYVAGTILLVFFGLIAFAWVQLRGLNAQIAERKARLEGLNETLARKEQEIAEKDQEIAEKQKSIGALRSLNGALSAVSRSYTKENPAAAEQVRQAVEQSIAQVVTQGPEAGADVAQIPPRVYIQITREEQRARAGAVARCLQAGGYVVPGIENVARKASPQDVSDVRYYQGNEAAEGDVEGIRAMLLKDFGVSLKTVQLPAAGAIRPRHYELWLGDDFAPAASVDTARPHATRQAPARQTPPPADPRPPARE